MDGHSAGTLRSLRSVCSLGEHAEQLVKEFETLGPDGVRAELELVEHLAYIVRNPSGDEVTQRHTIVGSARTMAEALREPALLAAAVVIWTEPRSRERLDKLYEAYSQCGTRKERVAFIAALLLLLRLESTVALTALTHDLVSTATSAQPSQEGDE